MKKFLPQAYILFLYIGLILFSVILSIKPGASIFYHKVKLDSNLARPDTGFAYRYPIKANPILFPPKKAILTEEGQMLKKITSAQLIEVGNGHFSIANPNSRSYYLYFAPTDNTDPRTNQKSYILFLPVIFFSRSLGLIYLSILGLLLIWFSSFTFKSPARRKTFTQGEWMNLIKQFVQQELGRVLFPLRNSEYLIARRLIIWKKIFLSTIFASYAYVAMEWLFFITKPSFFDLVDHMVKLEVLLQTGLLLALPTLLILVLLWVADRLLGRIHKTSFPIFLASLLPTAILVCLTLLLVDNFSYTLFSYGVVSTEGLWRSIYAVLFVIGFAFLHRQILTMLGLRGRKDHSPFYVEKIYYANYGLLALSSILILARFDFSATGNLLLNVPGSKISARPNIILLGSDGLNADNLSIYGYDRATTPTLLGLVSSSLLAENAFPNSAQSSGSVISILTSRLPTQTRVLNTPDILKGKDAFLHLPGILRREGYTTAEIGLVHYIDAYNLNMRNAFDTVNNRTIENPIYFDNLHNSSLDDTFYFIHLLIGRISERLLHIFFIQTMSHPISEVIGFEDFHRDEQRIENLIDLITFSNEPFFVHVHFMGTHGAEFFPTVQRYTLGQTQTGEWMTDFYDDAILSFDDSLKTILDALERGEKLDNTILILYSDHGQEYRVNHRIPLLFRFPNGEYAGRITANAQNIDIAPTILDYLDLPIPEWMEGLSLLQIEIPENRLIMAAGMKMDRSDRELLRPPFYQFGFFNIIQCDEWYRYDVELRSWQTGKIIGHTAPCSSDTEIFSFVEIEQELVSRLSRDLFDISSLQAGP